MIMMTTNNDDALAYFVVSSFKRLNVIVIKNCFLNCLKDIDFVRDKQFLFHLSVIKYPASMNFTTILFTGFWWCKWKNLLRCV